MKTVCVYHSSDLDGWMSAAIIKHWFIINHKNYHIKPFDSPIDVTGDAPLLVMLGYNYGQPIPDLSEYDKVIMCDISFSSGIMERLYLQFEEDSFIWLDHHKSIIEEVDNLFDIHKPNVISGLRRYDFAACELTWKYFFPNEPMSEIVRLLGRYDCFGHKGTDEEQKVLEFQYGARNCISNYNQAYDWLINCIEDEKSVINTLWEAGGFIYQYLCTEAKQNLEHSFVINLEFHSKVDNSAVMAVIYNFRCINKVFNPSAFNLEYSEDGFATFVYSDSKKKWTFTLYSNKEHVDCSLIAKVYGGGGHKGAAGFLCDTETMLKIINND